VTWLDLLALLGAGGVAGLINTVVGSGTLITFPTLLGLGVPPVIANVSNTVGLARCQARGPRAGNSAVSAGGCFGWDRPRCWAE
jgi:hypothetical protein